MVSDVEDITLSTPRLKLREWQDQDAAALLKLAAQPGFYYNALQATINSARALIDRSLKQRQLLGPSGTRASFRLAITLPNGSIIGGIDLTHFDAHPELMQIGYELFYFIDPRHRGRRYTEEAAQALIDHAARHYGIKTLVATAALDNVASIRILENLGFSRQDKDCSFLEMNDGKPRLLYTRQPSL